MWVRAGRRMVYICRRRKGDRMNEITCKVCGNKFTPFKSRKYEVVIPSPSFSFYDGQPRIGEAFDCPMCGCQHIVNTRYKNAKEGD